jgi:Tol biopolymer transport system component
MSRMSRRSIVLVAALTLAAPRVVAQSANDLFQKALAKERAEGQIEAAIQLYEQVVREFASDRVLAARALVQLGRCYERLGKAEARKAYERVLSEYADQRAPAADARARLARLDAAAPAPGPMARRLWSGTGVDLEGAPTADGRYLTFVDWETGDVAVRDLASGTSRRLTRNPRLDVADGFANASAPSPDGKRVAYAWFNNAAGAFELRIVGMDGSGEQVLFSRPAEYVMHLAWMPDGRAVAIAFKRSDGTHQIAIVTLADRRVRALRTFDWRAVTRISVSPDGRYLAYDFPPREDSPRRDIFAIATDGSAAATLVEHAANDLQPIWSPDGRQLLFVSDRTGTAGLWSVPVSAGKAAGAPRLVQPIGNFVPLGFTATAALFYGLDNGSVDIHIASIDPATGRLVGEPRPAAPRQLGSNSRPDWSADGRWLAYQSERVPGGGMGSRVVSILSIETGLERELSPRLNYFQRPRWAPDGRTIVVSGTTTSGRTGFHAIDVATGATAPMWVAGPNRTAFGQSWAPDGASLFFTTRDDDGPFIAARDTRTGEIRAVYRRSVEGGAGDVAVSRDGRWLAFRESGKTWAIKVIPAAGGEAREIARVAPPHSIPGFGGLNWTPDGRHVYFVRASGPLQETRELWRAPVDGGAAMPTGLAARALRDSRLHPDGRQMAYTAGEGNSEVWVLEHLLEPVSTTASGRGTRR